MRSLPLAASAASLLMALAIPFALVHAEKAPQSLGTRAIDAAVAAPTRTPANVLRDRYRHPAQTLAFFGVRPGQTVVEYSPAGGWYTEILAPLLKDKGVFYAAQSPGKGFNALKAKLAADPATYGKVRLVPWPTAGAIPDHSVDTLVTFRNIHNMVMDGDEAVTFKAFFTMLKPGGTLGIVDHRLPEDRDIALEKSSGYLKTSTVRRIAEAAGFKLVAASEVNANPLDKADYPKGVWTLPPSLTNGDVDKAKYLAIGESDRMTLKFIKPVK